MQSRRAYNLILLRVPLGRCVKMSGVLDQSAGWRLMAADLAFFPTCLPSGGVDYELDQSDTFQLDDSIPGFRLIVKEMFRG